MELGALEEKITQQRDWYGERFWPLVLQAWDLQSIFNLPFFSVVAAGYVMLSCSQFLPNSTTTGKPQMNFIFEQTLAVTVPVLWVVWGQLTLLNFLVGPVIEFNKNCGQQSKSSTNTVHIYYKICLPSPVPSTHPCFCFLWSLVRTELRFSECRWSQMTFGERRRGFL